MVWNDVEIIAVEEDKESSANWSKPQIFSLLTFWGILFLTKHSSLSFIFYLEYERIDFVKIINIHKYAVNKTFLNFNTFRHSFQKTFFVIFWLTWGSEPLWFIIKKWRVNSQLYDFYSFCENSFSEDSTMHQQRQKKKKRSGCGW